MAGGRWRQQWWVFTMMMEKAERKRKETSFSENRNQKDKFLESFRGERIIYDEEDELQENDSEFLQSGTMQYQTRDRSWNGIISIHTRE
ncbi:hypothetical protein RJ640_009446 [Escallonia rubra]|uniref:Uncharacterized protein n=1 Tax=Escallonia rubra TaxID=112253 RepID=A0AA88QUZ4_9ASTE|nr:hypothetical protein RJ640_009446 [Escallonia rubra]